eukprot:7021064-Prymnesium_polylepis.1
MRWCPGPWLCAVGRGPHVSGWCLCGWVFFGVGFWVEHRILTGGPAPVRGVRIEFTLAQLSARSARGLTTQCASAPPAAVVGGGAPTSPPRHAWTRE